jgi:hypothetical protein
MKKLLLLLICLAHLFCFAQSRSSFPKEEYTILYLIPFFSELSTEITMNEIESDYDIYAYNSFQLISFWEGAQIALQEFDRQNINLNVIVRDVTSNDTEKLRKICEDTILMKNVNLIIGPFYKNIFDMAAQYALYYKIPIINPFSNRKDFLKQNPYAYKAMPSQESKPLWIEKKLLSKYKNAKVILYSDHEKSEDMELYKKHFMQKDSASFAVIPFRQGIANLSAALDRNRHNVIIASSKSISTIINNIRLLVNQDNLPPFTVVIPENWLTNIEGELENFNSLNAAFFSNYYVNSDDDKTLYFMTEFAEKFHLFPAVDRFAYQGYDITRYFILCIIHNFDTSQFDYFPTALDFHFQQIGEDDGFENQSLWLLQLQNFEMIEVK